MVKAMYFKPRRLAALLGPVLAVLCYAAPASAISLMQAYDAAVINDPTYRAAFYSNEQGKENRILGRAGLLPSLSASYSVNKNNTDRQIGKSLDHPKYSSNSANLQLRQAIINLDAIARFRQGIAQSNASAAQLEAQRQELVLRVVGSYVEALFATDQMQLVQVQRDMYREQMQVNNKLFQKGEGTKTDMLETQARLDLSEAELIEATDNRTNALNTLSEIVGQPVTSVDALADNFRVRPTDTLAFEQWKDAALTNNPELKVQAFSIDIARQEYNKARSGHLPRLDFVASYNKSDSETINTLNQEITARSIGLQLNIPLYSGGAVNAQSRQAAAGIERAKAEMEAKKDKILIDLNKEYNLIVSGVERINALVKAVDSGKLLIRATEQSVKGGVRINLDLLNAQERLYTSQRDLSRARYNYLLGTLRMRAAAGSLSQDDVREIATYFR